MTSYADIGEGDITIPPEIEGFDIIGDVHGCAHTLKRLLEQLGYRQQSGVYYHPKRCAIFLGDIIDRGPRIRESLHLVRDMVERGSAHLILGNHELNALAYTRWSSKKQDYLRSHTQSHQRQISQTLVQMERYPREWEEFLSWFETLPLFLEIKHPRTGNAFRVVHACWDQRMIEAHRARYGIGISPEFIEAAYSDDTLESQIRQRLTGGVDLDLPEGVTISSCDGYVRSAFRTKFWATRIVTYGDVVFQPDPLPHNLAASKISIAHRQQLVNYDVSEPPLFVGHYWLRGRPAPLAPNLACLDYSAVKYGRLVAYRMDGERRLLASKFTWVDVEP